MDDGFAVPAEWFPAEFLESGDRAGEVLFSGLTISAQRGFENTTTPAVEASVRGLAREAEIFRLINTGGVAQDETSLAKAAAVESSE
ncbi:hypothetical protein ASE14_00225 [Agromyces sp. Root81]|uniref:hypothetical protein n=1 Tax=Agromyces sp. Root81 TaxID=1736601 RepID=UPI0006F1DA23|nr:hypothetical protein [Agromyces sp. Root81]KRC62319.1 hypothetical protein ASE14_00225 [Agromyces sp. Root81]